MKNVLLVCLGLAVLALPAQAQFRRLNDPDPYQSAYRAIEEKMKTSRISLDFQEAPLEDVIQFMRQVLNINILIDPEIYKEKSRDEMKVTLSVKDLRASSALNLLLSFHNLARSYKSGIMVITTKERKEETTFLVVYDVRDLMFTVRDFPGPKIGLGTATGGNTSGVTFEDADDSNVNELSSPDRLLEIIKGNSGGSSWEDNSKVSASMINGLLVVNQTRSGHYEVYRLLNMLRTFR